MADSGLRNRSVKMAYLFDAVNEGIDVGTMGSWDPTVFTAWGWIFPTTTAGEGIWQKGNQSSPFQRVEMLWRNIDGDLLVRKTGTTQLFYSIVPTPFTTGEWQFYAATMDVNAGAGEKIKVYRGTLFVPPRSQAMTVGTEGASLHSHSTYNMRLGRAADDEPLQGRLARVGFIDGVVLTQSDIVLLWKLSRTETLSYPWRLKGSWPLRDAVTDLSGNGYHGTVTGATRSTHIALDPQLGFMGDLRWLLAAQAPAPGAGGLFRNTSLSGLGAGGPFFHEPLSFRAFEELRA